MTCESACLRLLTDLKVGHYKTDLKIGHYRIDPWNRLADQLKTARWLRKFLAVPDWNRGDGGRGSGIRRLVRSLRRCGVGGGRLVAWCRCLRRGRGSGRLRWWRLGGCAREGPLAFGWGACRGAFPRARGDGFASRISFVCRRWFPSLACSGRCGGTFCPW